LISKSKLNKKASWEEVPQGGMDKSIRPTTTLPGGFV